MSKVKLNKEDKLGEGNYQLYVSLIIVKNKKTLCFCGF